MQTEIKPRTFRVFIWNISEPIADFFFNLSNAILIFGAFLVFAGTIGTIWMQAAKSYFSDERIAANEAATARAKADAEIAHAKALEAQLALEKYKAPRKLDSSQQKIVADALRSSPAVKYDLGVVPGDAEATILMNNIENALNQAGWREIDWNGGDVSLTRAGHPSAGIVTASDVTIALFPAQHPNLIGAAMNLAGVLNRVGIPAKTENTTTLANNAKDAVHILVGRKTQ